MVDCGGDSADSGCHRPGGEFLPVGIAGVHHMGVPVHTSGHDITSADVDHFGSFTSASRCEQRLDFPITDKDIRGNAAFG